MSVSTARKNNIRMDAFLNRFSEPIRDNIKTELQKICENIERMSLNIRNKRKELCVDDCCGARVHRKDVYSSCSRRYRVIILEDGRVMEKSNCTASDWEKYSKNKKNKKLCMTHAKKDKKDDTKRVYEKYGMMCDDFSEPCSEIQPHCIALVEDSVTHEIRQCKKNSLKASEFCCLCVRDWDTEKVFEPAHKYGSGAKIGKYYERFGTITNPVPWLDEYVKGIGRRVKGRQGRKADLKYTDNNIDDTTLNKQHQEAVAKMIAKMNAEHDVRMAARSSNSEEAEEEMEFESESESESESGDNVESKVKNSEDESTDQKTEPEEAS